MSKPLISYLIDSYVEEHTTREIPLLYELNRQTNLKVMQPVMMSGHLQGTFLSMISHMIQPEKILEIGTFTGYSALCLASGLKANGILHTIDIDEELLDFAQKYITKANFEGKIIQHHGDATLIVNQLDEQFDLVFIDADKPNYCLYYDLVFNKVPIGGYILADNVLYEGEVVLPEEEQSKNAKAIHKFNTKIKNDNRIEHVLLPIRDGIMMIRKISN